MNLDFIFTESWIHGAIGGGAVGIISLLRNLPGLVTPTPHSRIGQFFLAHLLVAVLFTLLGAMMAMSFEGKSGSVITGIGAMTLVTALAGYGVDRVSHSASPDAGENR